jgi:hypothetical protein
MCSTFPSRDNRVFDGLAQGDKAGFEEDEEIVVSTHDDPPIEFRRTANGRKQCLVPVFPSETGLSGARTIVESKSDTFQNWYHRSFSPG